MDIYILKVDENHIAQSVIGYYTNIDEVVSKYELSSFSYKILLNRCKFSGYYNIDDDIYAFIPSARNAYDDWSENCLTSIQTAIRKFKIKNYK